MFKFVGALIKIQISTVSMIYTTFLFLVNPNTTPHFVDALHSILNPLMITRWSIFCCMYLLNVAFQIVSRPALEPIRSYIDMFL